MSFLQDFSHRAILTSSKVIPPPPPKKVNLIHRTPITTKRTPAFTSTDNTGINDLSLFTGQGPRGLPNVSGQFQGSPNVTITSINTSGGIVSSRTSGLTPCFVQVSASGITAAGTSTPYEDLEYTWDFGDPTGSEYVIDPLTNVNTNLNSAQSGPEAAYCYRLAGTYTITLNIRGHNGSSFTSTSITQNVTVTTFTPVTDLFVDFSAAGGGSGSIGSPFNSIAQVNSALANSTRFNFKRGTSTTGATGIDLSTAGTLSHLRFQDYGSGTLPVITVNGTASGFFMDNGGASTGHPKDDIVVSNISFQTASGFNPINGGVVGATKGNASSLISNYYLDNCIISNSIDPSTHDTNIVDYGGDATTFTNCGVWLCTTTGLLQATATVHCRQGISGGIKSWFFAIGNSVSGSGADPTRDHHIYMHCQTHGCFGFNKFGLTATVGNAPTKNLCIKTSFDVGEGDGGFYAQYFNLSRNYMTGTQRACDAGEANNNPANTRIKNYVGQQNFMVGLTGDGNILPYTAETRTERDHNVWNCKNRWFAAAPGQGTTTFLKAQIYRNKIYKTDSAIDGSVLDYTGVTWTTKQVITDNKIYTTNASANLNDIVFTDQTAAGSLIDRNQYWAPNAVNFLFNNASSVSFATWKANGWDVNGSNADPHWPDPANGNFG